MDKAAHRLALVLRKRAARMLDDDGLGPESRDNAELINVLARLIEGNSVHKSFGAPGDWGYGTEIGDALAAFYKTPKPATAP